VLYRFNPAAAVYGEDGKEYFKKMVWQITGLIMGLF
jgi:hypothetical protein